MIGGLLQDMNFMKTSKINYDPHHIISHTRQHNKNKDFDHRELEGLYERANLMECQSSAESSQLKLSMNHAATLVTSP